MDTVNARQAESFEGRRKVCDRLLDHHTKENWGLFARGVDHRRGVMVHTGPDPDQDGFKPCAGVQCIQLEVSQVI